MDKIWVSEQSPAMQTRQRFWRVVGYSCALAWVILALVLGIQAWQDTKQLKIDSLHAAVDIGAVSLDATFNNSARTMEAAFDREFGVSPDLDAARWQRVVLAAKNNVPTLADVSFVDPSDKILASSNRRVGYATQPRLTSSASHQEFLNGLMRGQGIYLGRTYQSETTGQWLIPLRMAIRDPEKRLIGALVASFPTSALAETWAQVALTRYATIGVVGDDGYLRARHPILNNVTDAAVYSEPRRGALIQHLRAVAHSQHGHVMGETIPGGVHTLAVFHRLRDYPATFFTQLPIGELWTQWWLGFRQPLVVLAILGLVVAYALRRVVKAEGQWIEEHNRSESARATIRSLSNRLINSEEDERRRLALDLHDDLGQVLTATKITLQSQLDAPPEEAQALCQQSIDLVAGALDTVRSLSRQLRPSILDDLGLAHAVRWLAKQVGDQSNMTVEVTGDFSQRLPAEIEIHGYRVVHQALTNIQRHAQAKRVTIHLASDNQEVRIVIHDNGIGFDVEQSLSRARSGGSIGLLGMQQRAQWLQGNLTIESSPGAGTTIELRLPLPTSSPEQSS